MKFEKVSKEELNSAQYKKLLSETEKILEECKLLKEDYQEKQKWRYKFKLFSKTTGAVIMWLFGAAGMLFAIHKELQDITKNKLAKDNETRETQELKLNDENIEWFKRDFTKLQSNFKDLEKELSQTNLANNRINEELHGLKKIFNAIELKIGKKENQILNKELQDLLDGLSSTNSKTRGESYYTIVEKFSKNKEIISLLMNKGKEILQNKSLLERPNLMGIVNILACLRALKNSSPMKNYLEPNTSSNDDLKNFLTEAKKNNSELIYYVDRTEKRLGI